MMPSLTAAFSALLCDLYINVMVVFNQLLGVFLEVQASDPFALRSWPCPFFVFCYPTFRLRLWLQCVALSAFTYLMKTTSREIAFAFARGGVLRTEAGCLCR